MTAAWALAVVFCVGLVSADDGTLIQTTYGTIQCFVQTIGELGKEKVARNCLGVPFASPPLGNLRFAPPIPPQSWTGVRNATQYSAACMQRPNGLAWTETGPEPISEDCLYLNVFAPLVTVQPPPGGFPVMVFLYGGCWEFGSAAFPFYHGDYFEGYSDKVVLVSVNYRLGAFGFLASQALQAQSPDGSTGNYGVQDQRMALYWVRDNIAAFGGNPNNVMLFGQSAGSGSTAFHVVAKRSAGLFHRATFESGPYAGWSSLNMTVSETHYQAMVRDLGCYSNGNGDQQIACLRSKPADDIVNNNADGSIIVNGCSWAPVVDGVELTAAPEYLAQTGQFNRVPLMLGTNTNEGSTFVVDCDASDEDYRAWLNETAGPDLGTLIYNRYPSSSYRSPFWAASMVMTDACMACPARRTARWLTYPPRRDVEPGVDVYLYHFEHAPDVTEPDRCLGVFHGAELPFVFYDKPFLDVRERDFGKQMVTWWQTFATNGNPNFVGAPIVWPKYDIYSDQNAGLSLRSTVETNLKKDNCDWWDAMFVANTWLC